MPWAFPIVTATVASTSTGSASATTTATITITGTYGITNALFADTSVGGTVGASTLALRQTSGTTTAPTTAPVAGATFVNGSVIHTITAYTSGTRTITFTPVLATAITNNASISLNPALHPGTHVVLTGAVNVTTSATISIGATSIAITALAANNGFSSAASTADFVGATFVNSGTTHTVTAATATTLTVTPSIAASIASGVTLSLSRQATYSVTTVSSDTNSVVTLFPQTGAGVPSVASATNLTFYNPLLQSGTDTTIGTALAGLASFRSDIINAFIDNVGGYASGATSMIIDNGSGVAPAIAPTVMSTFLNSTRVHRVTSYNAGTRTITFSPPLNAAISNDAAITLFTPGVVLNRGDGANGLDSYTVNSTRVRITGTFTQNAWAEQLVIAANCPGEPGTVNSALAQLVFAGTITLNGVRSGWGSGSGSICPTPIIIGNIQGNDTSGNCFLYTASGTIIFNDSIVQANSYIDLRLGTITYNRATFSNSGGASSGSGNPIHFSGTSTYNGLTIVGYRDFYASLTNGAILSNINFDGTAGFASGQTTGSVTLLNLSTRNTLSVIIFRTTFVLGACQTILSNNATGSNPGVTLFVDTFFNSGGHLLIQKQLTHLVRNLSGSTLAGVKIYIGDTQNLQRYNWFTSGINRAIYDSTGVIIPSSFPAIVIAGSTVLTSLWDGNNQRSYLWTTTAGGSAASQSVLLAYVSNPNRRTGQIACVSKGVAPSNATGATTIAVDNGTGLFANRDYDIGAPQVNGYFVWAGTTHIITSVTSGGTVTSVAINNGGTGYTSAPTISFSGGGATTQATATATIAGGAVTAITIIWAGIGYTSAPTISFSGGGGSGAAATATVYTNSDYILGISPALSANVPDNTSLPVQNVWYDCRNKTRLTAVIDHPSAGTYAVNSTSIVVDNGADALLATTPVPYSNFIHAGEIYLITAVSSTSTEHTLTISPPLRASIANNASITLENIPGSDFFDSRAASYQHLPQFQELNLTGTGTLTNSWTLLDDATITQTNKATVDGYTTLTTAAQVYDRAKSWWYDNFENLTASQQGAVLVTRSGTTLNAGSYGLTLATSGTVFGFASNTITINAPTFTNTLTTTGTITLNNPSTSQINYASGIVPAGGTVALAVAGTYDLSGWTFASTGVARTISNTSGGTVIAWLNPNQVANVTGSGANLSIVAKPQSLAAPNLADGTRAYAARVQSFTIASAAIDTSTDTITLGNDSQGLAAALASAAPWTQVRFSLQSGATLPATTGNVLKDGGFYYWSGGKLYTSIANIPATPVDFTSQGSGNFTLQTETELFNVVVSGGAGLSQSLTQPDGILIRLKGTKWSETAGNASATQFLDTRDSLITWSAFTGATVSSTLELEAVHEQIVATSYVQSGKYGQLFPAKRGDQFGGKFSIALEGVGTLQINADDDTSNPAGVELLQDIFLWWCWVRSTEAGIRLASYDTLAAINFTTYQAGRVEVENTDATIPLIIAGGSISFAGSSNGIASTSNAIYLNVDVFGVVAITGVAATDIRSAVGLASANLDSQLGDITALVL